MSYPHPVIGWKRTTPVPDRHRFNSHLNVRGGRLHFEDLDLTSLFTEDDNELGRTLPSPLEIVYLPLIGNCIRQMRQVFSEVSSEVGYGGRFHYTYASKANADGTESPYDFGLLGHLRPHAVAGDIRDNHRRERFRPACH